MINKMDIIGFIKRHWKKALLVLMAAIALELLAFNFRAWESMRFHEIDNFSVSYGEDSQISKEGTVLFAEGQSSIELTEINQKVNNIYLDIARTGGMEDTDIQISAIDEGSAVYYLLPSITISSVDRAKQYIRLNLNGKVKSLKIEFCDMNGQEITVNQISLNVQRPFLIDLGRIVVIFAVGLFLLVLRGLTGYYLDQYNLKKTSHFSICMILVLIQLMIVIFSTFSIPRYVNPKWEHHFQYENLAKSLTEGHFYLDEEPLQKLKDMENPYDSNLRSAQDVPFVWDQAYYNGKYYVYFGIVPVLAFYLPYYLVTGAGFPTVLGIIICEIALAFGILFLLDSLFRRYFKKVTLGVFLLMDILVFLGCGSLIITKEPTFYGLPVIMGLALVVWGLYFWNSAVEKADIRWKRIFLGSCCMALTAGCRPQMLLACFTGLFLIAPQVYGFFKEKKEKSMIKLGGCLLPFAVVAGFLMYYNFARFGSPFDFGANYNLTTNDMTKRGFRLDRLPLGIYTFLFQPPSFTTLFPFMQKVDISTLYQGITIHEGMYGGLLMLNPFLWAVVLMKGVTKSFKNKKLLGFTVSSLVCGVVIVIADIEMAGILMRYMCDFGIFLCIPAAMILMEYLNHIQDRTFYLFFQKMICAVTIVTVILSGLYLAA